MASRASSDVSEAPSEALMELLAPDGYYTYLKITKTAAAAGTTTTSDQDGLLGTTGAPTTTIDPDQVKKNYRKLSLKHHPDKRGGDVETFRVLNRAKRVLLSPKLRQQYDILGIDLDDDEHDGDDGNDDNHHNGNNSGGDQDGGGENSGSKNDTSTAQGIVQEIASQILTNLIQLLARTVMMGGVSVVLVRFRWTLYPALAFLSYITFQLFQRSRVPGGGTSSLDALSPLMIATGLLLMHRVRRAAYLQQQVEEEQDGGGGTATTGFAWTWVYWMGETIVIFMFCYNSFATALPRTPLITGAMAVVAMLAALWFRGSFWNYVIVVAFEAFLALFVALVFPVMELVLEAVLNEKLRKVGDKVRAHHQVLERYYESKRNEDLARRESVHVVRP